MPPITISPGKLFSAKQWRGVTKLSWAAGYSEVINKRHSCVVVCISWRCASEQTSVLVKPFWGLNWGPSSKLHPCDSPDSQEVCGSQTSPLARRVRTQWKWILPPVPLETDIWRSSKIPPWLGLPMCQRYFLPLHVLNTSPVLHLQLSFPGQTLLREQQAGRSAIQMCWAILIN